MANIKKENRGGPRPGSGRKSPIHGEVKERVTIRIYPSKLAEIAAKYGSIQKAVDKL